LRPGVSRESQSSAGWVVAAGDGEPTPQNASRCFYEPLSRARARAARPGCTPAVIIRSVWSCSDPDPSAAGPGRDPRTQSETWDTVGDPDPVGDAGHDRGPGPNGGPGPCGRLMEITKSWVLKDLVKKMEILLCKSSRSLWESKNIRKM